MRDFEGVMRLGRLVVGVVVCGFPLGIAGQAPVAPGLQGAALEAEVRALMAKMTVEEKILQLLENPPNGVARLGIPDLRWGEVLHGVVADGATSFPAAVGMGATWDPALIEQMGTVVAQEARALGVDQGYAPMLGLARDPRWGRVEESYGEDPYLVGQIGVAYIEGLQGMGAERFGRDHIFATPKHFVADGEPWAGANGGDFEMSDRVLREVYLPPFEAAVKVAGAEAIMPGHHAINGVPNHANAWLLRDLLRKEWGFTGFTVSDMGDIPKLYDGHGYARSYGDAAVMALKAGVDQELEGGAIEEHVYAKYLGAALKDGELSMATVDEAVARVLRAKVMLLGVSAPSTAAPVAPVDDAVMKNKGYGDVFAGLMAAGKVTTRAGGERAGFEAVLKDPAHDRLALKVAEESMVLLKNEGHLLPLDEARTKRVLVVGALGVGVNLGGYSTGKPKFYVDAVAGLKAELGAGATVVYEAGGSVLGATDAELARAVAAAKDADVVIAVVGHTRAQLGENHDRDSLDLPGRQEQLVEAMVATGKPVVVVLNNGGVFALPWIHDHVPAVVESWYGGQSYGTALAEVLFGAVNPSGRLPVTVPVSVGQTPAYYNHPVLTGPILYDPAKTEFPVPFGRPNVLWAFGHGLSYTEFRYGPLRVIRSGAAAAEVSVDVMNVGKREGDEVVQMYLHQDATSLKRPVMELKGFKRVTLKPGETRTVSFPVGFEQVKFWKDGKWVMEAGELQVMVGAASDDIRAKQTLVLQ